MEASPGSDDDEKRNNLISHSAEKTPPMKKEFFQEISIKNFHLHFILRDEIFRSLRDAFDVSPTAVARVGKFQCFNTTSV